MKKNIYNYHKYDLRKNRNLYQYSKYFGQRFILDYFRVRNRLLKNYNLKNFFFKKKIINDAQIKALCRKFEIKKKLFKNKMNPKEFSINDYIKTSDTIIHYILTKKNYSILSSLLKMNDLILYIHYKNKNQKNLEQIKKVIFLESFIIKKTINEQKIK